MSFTNRAYVYTAKTPTENAEIVRQQLERAHRYYNVLIDVERERAVAKTGLAAEERKAVDERFNARVREERARCGVYWGTYLHVEDAVQRAAKMSVVVAAKKEGCCPRCKRTFQGGELITFHTKQKLLLACSQCGNGPRYRRWQGDGLLAVQIQRGMAVDELLDGSNSRVRLVGEGKRRMLWLRVGSAERAPLWAVFPIIYHRPIPGSARIKGVAVCARHCGTHTEWSVHFSLEAPAETWMLPAPAKSTIAVDVGWRDYGSDGLRVAVWVNDAGAQGELRLPRSMLDRDQKVADLQSIRGKNFNSAQDWFVTERRLQTSWPAWLVSETKSLHAWRAPGKLAALIVRWRNRRWAGDDALYARLETWRKQDKHLLEWECHQRAAVLRERREAYRLFALELAQYRKVVVEQLDLTDLAIVDEDPEKRLTHNSRAHRFDAGLSFMLNYAADAVRRAGGDFVEVDPSMTTQTCNVCGQEERFDAAPSVDHVCSHCGVTWDQDCNAARNLLARAATCSPKAGVRSRKQVVDSTVETPAAARRRKGLATRRARRSKTDAQVSENAGV